MNVKIKNGQRIVTLTRAEFAKLDAVIEIANQLNVFFESEDDRQKAATCCDLLIGIRDALACSAQAEDCVS